MAQHVNGSREQPAPTADETTALLSPRRTELEAEAEADADAEQGPCSSTNEHPALPHQSRRRAWPWIYVVAVLVCLAFVADMGETLFTAPRVRFLESVACSRYYAHHDPSRLDSGGSVPELLCKIDAVQTEVASVMGWQLFFDSIPAILLPIPYGYLADTRGRKWILIMGLTGYTLSLASILYLIGVLGLPLRFTWFSSLFFLIGGGPTVATTMLTTMVADVVPTNLRSTVFFYRFCSDQLADLVVPPIAPMLMAKGTMHPLIVAVGLQLLALALALPLPETLSSTDPKTSDGICTASPVPGVPQSSDTCRPRQDLASWLPRIKESFAFVLRDTTVACLVYTFFISKLGRQANGVLFQYASKRYGWSIAQASYS
ncbi:hypothetical protein BM221_003293 [Beauveria bassiana]|uniref:MFS transporter n=1 Tax=Beauveria bassiana TaxID=176275 RepID=A0A2N6NU92_BEABA|nr:hypothetical protein BM221_003293 [Beauveria bassiana]